MATLGVSRLSDRVENLIIHLHEMEAVKFGDFVLKSGIKSPIYFDLRVMISFPEVMTEVSNLLWEKLSHTNFKTICGVPYTALPLATLMSANYKVPMLIRRKEAKGYGTRKLIEGKFVAGDACLIVEDVVSSGSSVLETAQTLQSEGISVKEAVVLLNREQGGAEKLESKGISLCWVFTMTDVVNVLQKAGKLSLEIAEQVMNYIAKNKFRPNEPIPSDLKPKVLSFSERAKLCTNSVSARLFQIMEDKKTNLALSADVTQTAELLQLAEKVGPYICVLKTHVDILEDFNQEFIQKLSTLASKHNFLIFEDRKFADIGNTVVQQFSGGLYRICEWATIVNAHTVPGSGIVQGLKKVGQPKGCACLLLAEMSSMGNLATGDYTAASVKMAEENKDFVIGFISVSGLSSDPRMVHMTPGVQLEAGKDSLGQQYLTPAQVITKQGSDVIIVGRGIYQAGNPVDAARQFRDAGYGAYLARLVH